MSDSSVENNIIRFFKPYKKYGLNGYHIPVRNSFSNRIEQEFIPEEAREIFESNFGETILKDTEFIDWYTRNADKFK